MAANPLAVLTKQFRALMMIESGMNPDERKLHQFQLLATHGKRLYLIVKGGANTIGYKIGDAKMQYCFPNDMMELLKKWSTEKFEYYRVFDQSTKKPLSKRSADLAILMEESKPEVSAYILGFAADGTKAKLYTRKPAVFGDSPWKKVNK